MAPPALAALACDEVAPSEAAALSAASTCGRPVVVGTSRSEYVQVKAQPDGRLTFESAVVPQRTRRANGQWAEVDLTLRADADGLVRPLASVAEVAFSRGGRSPLVTLQRGGKSLLLLWPGDLPSPALSGDSATYPNVLPDVDLVVRATHTGFTHVLVVKTAKAAANPAVRTMSLGVGGDAQVERLADGSLRAVAGNTLLAQAGSAVMWDSSLPGDVARSIQPEAAASTARMAGDGARTASVATRVTSDGDLELVPDVRLLTAADVNFPVYVDPDWSVARTRWAYATNTNCTNTDYSVARAGLAPNGSPPGPCDGDLFRSFFDFPTTDGTVSLSGKHIQSAYVQMNLYHSSSCGPTWMNMYLTPTINATMKASWSAMSLNTWVASAAGNANKKSCGPQPDLIMNFIGSGVTSTVQTAANDGWGGITFGFSARDSDGTDESTTDRWKKFYPAAARLIVDYDSKPGLPNSLQIAGVACPPGGVAIGTLTPTFSAVYPDGDSGQTLTGTYEWIEVPAAGMGAVTDTSPTRQTAPPAASATANGRATTSAVSGLALGRQYAYRVKATDPAPYSRISGWSEWCQFWPETQVPPAPTITAGASPGPGRPITFTFSTTTSAVVKFRYGWSSPPATEITATGTGPRTATVTLTVPKYGKNILWVRAIDGVGNLGNISSKEFTVGRPSPAVARWGLESYPGQTQAQALADAQPALGDTDGSGPLVNNTPLTAPNVTWAEDVHLFGGQTASFNGTSSQAVTAGPVVSTAGSFSVAAWLRAAPYSGCLNLSAMSADGVGASAFILEYDCWANRYRMRVADREGGVLAEANSPGPTALGRWTHVAGVWDAVDLKIKLYVDGVLVSSVTPASSWLASRGAGYFAAGPLVVGRSRSSGSNMFFFKGEMADVQVFDRVLVDHDFAGQLASDPQSGGVDEPGILAPVEVGRWDFELARPCYIQDLADTCDAADGTAFGRWLALSRGTAVAAGQRGNGLQLDGVYFPDENPPPWEPTQEWGRSATKAGLTPPDGDGNQHTIWQEAPVLRTDQSLTVSTWVKVDALSDGDQVVLMQGGWPWWSMILHLGGATDKWTFGVSSPNGSGGFTWAWAESNAVATPNVWVHLAGVFDRASGQTRLYVNGVEQAAKGANGVGWNGTSSLHVGTVWGSWSLLGGGIDQVQAYAGAMTRAQVKSIYDAQVVQL